MNLTAPKPRKLEPYYFATVFCVLAGLGIIIWGLQIPFYKGSLYGDSGHLLFSYSEHLTLHLSAYLPWRAAHRPIGRDAITLLLRIFGEDHVPILSTLLAIHICNSFLCFLLIFAFSQQTPIAAAGAVIFLTSINAFLPIYWPAAIFDLLATTFELASALCLIYALLARGTRRWLLGLNLAFFLFAVKTKESSILLVVPLSFMVLSYLARNCPVSEKADRAGLTRSIKRIETLLRSIPRPGVCWYLALLVLAVILAANVGSDFHDAAEYARDYSFNRIFTSFGLYLANYCYVANSLAPIPATLSFVIIILLGSSALFFRSELMFIGLIWWFSLLVVLATITLRYADPHYPYPATVGGALYLAGLLSELSRRFPSERSRRTIIALLSAGTVGATSVLSFYWVRNDSLPMWTMAFYDLSTKTDDALKAAVRRPPHGTELVIVDEKFTFLNQNPTTALRAVYHDLSLEGRIFKTELDGRNYFDQETAPNRYLLIWRNGHFKILSKVRNNRTRD